MKLSEMLKDISLDTEESNFNLGDVVRLSGEGLKLYSEDAGKTYKIIALKATICTDEDPIITKHITNPRPILYWCRLREIRETKYTFSLGKSTVWVNEKFLRGVENYDDQKTIETL